MLKYITHCDEVELVHVTTEDRLGSILETGIRPSAFGDMAVGEDDGRAMRRNPSSIGTSASSSRSS